MSRPITKKIKEEFIEDAYGSLQQGCSVRGKGTCRCFREEIQGEQNTSPCGISIRRTAKGLEYNCFKASCELGGGIVGCGSSWVQSFGRDVYDDAEKPRAYQGVPQEFAFPANSKPCESESARRWLSQFSVGAVEITRYGIAERQTDTRGLYFPVRGLDGNYRGYMRRDLGGTTGGSGGDVSAPKWVAHIPAGEVYLSLPRKRNKIVFLVEDILSVIRLGKNDYNAVGLLGTSLRREQLPTLMAALVAMQPTKVVVALDPDATDKAKKIEKDLTTYWQGVKAITTQSDPKWWTDEQIERIGA
jgi:hypothetical protein